MGSGYFQIRSNISIVILLWNWLVGVDQFRHSEKLRYIKDASRIKNEIEIYDTVSLANSDALKDFSLLLHLSFITGWQQ